MDFLKRELAPLSDEAWEEIDERAVQVLKTHLSARKVVRVIGPLGWDHNAVDEGRLNVIEQPDGEVQTGTYRVRPLVETRLDFELDRWEMDNITRGARDADLESLEVTMKKMASFEETAIYKGYDKGDIQGLLQVAEHEPLSFGDTPQAIMDAVSKAVLVLGDAFEEGPYSLVVGQVAWQRLHEGCSGYPLAKRAKDLIGGDIFFSSAVDGALMIPHDHDDLELTLGGDFSIGYVAHDARKVRLYAASSFLFRVLNPELIVPFGI